MSQHTVSDTELGRRLRLAREARRITQQEAAASVPVARTTLVAIEQGRRRGRIAEIQRLASLYGVSANSILRREAAHLDLLPQFRQLPGSTDRGREEAARLLHRLVSAELELEDALGVRRVQNSPPEQPLLPGDLAAQAEETANEVRTWIGLGDGAVLDLVSLLERRLGVRIYARPLDSRISGLFAWNEAAGACVLLNAVHPPARMAQTAAHELGHLVATRRKPEVLLDSEVSVAPEERFATLFGRAFLTPARAVRRCFANFTAGHTRLTRRHVILLAHTFGVSREAMVRRLEELQLTKKGTWDWFQQHGGITDAHSREVLGDATVARAAVSQRLTLLAREAWRRGWYSEGQLAEMLLLDRPAVRELLDGAEQEVSEAPPLGALSA